MTQGRIDLDEVRAALTTRAVLEAYGWEAKRSGDEMESRACPTRSDHSRRAFLINANTGRWRCFPCATSGDLFDFIAAVERISVANDFPVVLAKAAEIAGVGPSTLSDTEREARRVEWRRKRQEAEARERKDREELEAAAIPKATAYWSTCTRQHDRGAAYLRERGVDELIALGDFVRFDPKHAGSPALALWTRDGHIRNVVRRRVPELGEPKTSGLYQCPSAGTLLYPVHQIEPDRDVVLTEGVVDTMTAMLAFPGAIVLGAHGAEQLPKIAKVAAPAAVAARTRLRLVPHRDKAGRDAAVRAGDLAIKAGLSIRKGTLVIVKHGAQDLNDAWRAGWRPCA